MPKIYLHYEGARGPEHTFVWRQRGGGNTQPSTITGLNLGEALDGFVVSYRKRHGPGAFIDATRLKLVAVDPTGVGRPVTLDIASDKPVDPELLPNGADVKVQDTANPTAPSSSSSAASVVTSRPAPAAPTQSRRATEKTGPSPEASSKAKKLAAKAEKLMAKENLRGSRDLLKEALELDRRNGRALRCLAVVYEKAGLGEEAFEAAKECCSSARDSGPADFLRAGRCLMELGRHAEARTALLRARAEGKGSVLDDTDAALARCSLKLGDGPAAANMYMQVLQRTGEQHLEALVGYGRLAMLVEQADNGIPSLLKAVVINQDHKEAREVLAEALGVPEGMSALKNQVAPTPDSSSVYSFLGTITKDHGEIDASVELLRVAATIDPRSASYALGLVHGREVAADNAGALTAAREYLSRNSTAGVGRAGARNSDILRVLEGIPAFSSDVPPISSRPQLGLEGVVVHWTTIPREQTADLPSPSPPSEASTSFNTSNAEDVSFAWCSCPLGEPEAEHVMTAAARETPGVESEAKGIEAGTPEDGQKIQTQEGKEDAEDGCDGGAIPEEGNGRGSGTPASAAEPAGGDETSAYPGVDFGDGAAQLEEQGEAGDARGRAVYEGWLRSPLGGGKEVYSAGDLDVLALHFAVVKILYLEGQWSCLPELLGVLEPTRVRSLMPLHRTNIRNEQAYYCCIAQLLSYASRQNPQLPLASGEISSQPSETSPGSSASAGTTNLPGGGVESSSDEAMTSAAELSSENPAGGSNRVGSNESGRSREREVREEATGEPVYVCGDSHTLTPAWQEISVGGRRRVLRPMLVTGLKHWHLRPESKFYPKKNFERVVKKIPDGSAVVFIFGEIDCREGLLVAVEKLRYDTILQGAERTIGIFIKVARKIHCDPTGNWAGVKYVSKWRGEMGMVAEDLARERGFKVYVHPVIPVLKETRGVVKMYNRVFRRMVRKSRHLHWLNFFDGLLGEKGENLRPEFGLDGTHLAPSYLGLLEKSLEGVWVKE